MPEQLYYPNAAMKAAARWALKKNAELPPSRRGMTAVGRESARKIVAGEGWTLERVSRMYRFFSRHQSNARAESDESRGFWGNNANPSKGWIAWKGWGGSPGFAWSRGIMRREGRIKGGK